MASKQDPSLVNVLVPEPEPEQL
eukprot:COSAG01_NODE_32707_length_577_cov_0.728033_1_plen_22_part_10